jgi:hypothetical protein
VLCWRALASKANNLLYLMGHAPSANPRVTRTTTPQTQPSVSVNDFSSQMRKKSTVPHGRFAQSTYYNHVIPASGVARRHSWFSTRAGSASSVRTFQKDTCRARERAAAPGGVRAGQRGRLPLTFRWPFPVRPSGTRLLAARQGWPHSSTTHTRCATAFFHLFFLLPFILNT